jgi:hypothetical protein
MVDLYHQAGDQRTSMSGNASPAGISAQRRDGMLNRSVVGYVVGGFEVAERHG